MEAFSNDVGPELAAQRLRELAAEPPPGRGAPPAEPTPVGRATG